MDGGRIQANRIDGLVLGHFYERRRHIAIAALDKEALRHQALLQCCRF